eukprot:1320406-Amorphochlora_amoeboformis.AAC.1
MCIRDRLYNRQRQSRKEGNDSRGLTELQQHDDLIAVDVLALVALGTVNGAGHSLDSETRDLSRL